MSKLDLEKVKAMADRFPAEDWFVLAPPWVGFVDTFTIMRGSPDPHVGVPILETLQNENADEDEDHEHQEALAEWLQWFDPSTVKALIVRVEELEKALEPFGEKAVEYGGDLSDRWCVEGIYPGLTLGDLRRAHYALAGEYKQIARAALGGGDE